MLIGLTNLMEFFLLSLFVMVSLLTLTFAKEISDLLIILAFYLWLITFLSISHEIF